MLTIELDRARVAAGRRILDVGCGGGRHAYACLRLEAPTVAIDLAFDEVAPVAGMIAAMRAEHQIGEVGSGVAVSHAEQLPFANGSFDCVIVSEVLEHLANDSAAVAEMVRVLRPGGIFALSVPRAGPERINWALSYDYWHRKGGHVRIYRRRQLASMLHNAGLRPTDAHHAHGLHAPYWWLRCAIGVDNDTNRLVRAYHRLLVWDIERNPWLTRVLDRALNPLIGKSLVLYFEKPIR